MNSTHGSNKDTKTTTPPIPTGNGQKASAAPVDTKTVVPTPGTPEAADDADEETAAQRVRRRFYVFHKSSGQKWDFKNKAEMSKWFNDDKSAPPKPGDVTIIQGHEIVTKQKVAF